MSRRHTGRSGEEPEGGGAFLDEVEEEKGALVDESFARREALEVLSAAVAAFWAAWPPAEETLPHVPGRPHEEGDHEQLVYLRAREVALVSLFTFVGSAATRSLEGDDLIAFEEEVEEAIGEIRASAEGALAAILQSRRDA